MSDRELVLAIAVSVLLALCVWQRLRIGGLYRSVDSLNADLDEEKLLRKAEQVMNAEHSKTALAEKDAEIKMLRKALDGSERKRKELATKYLEESDE